MAFIIEVGYTGCGLLLAPAPYAWNNSVCAYGVGRDIL